MYTQKGLKKILDSYNDNIAIEENGQVMTYAELLEKSEKVSAFLVNSGFGEKARVGICADNVMDMVICILGTLRARCIFIPVDASLPDKRFSLIIKKSAPDVIISSGGANIDQKIASIQLIRLVSILKSPVEKYQDRYIDYQENDDLYIYFTSGSTGEPKGIVGKNSSLWHFIEWEINTFMIEPGKRFSQLISPYFDAFLRDIFVPLMSGGTICVPPREEGLFVPEKLIWWIDKEEINFIHCVPSVFRIFNNKNISPENYRALNYILLSGERIVPSELTNWYNTFNARIQLVNLYGATEATMISSYYNIEPQDTLKAKIPIGKPISDVELVILDKNQRPCKQLIAGELFIVSNYLSNGYLDDTLLMEEKFIKLYGKNGEQLAFKTGDSARILADGNIDLLGREDRLIKLRGIRIELDEIERILRKCQLVENAVVIYDKNSDCLSAFVKFVMDCVPPDEFIGQVEKYLADYLPAYMIPSKINVIDSIPLLNTGKIDYNLLLKRNENVSNLVAPANETEKKVFALWKEILNAGKISTDKNFQAAGGNSLNMMRLMSRIFFEFNVRISLAELFTNLTIQKQALLIQLKLGEIIESGIEQNTASEENISLKEDIEKAQHRPYYTLPPSQKRLYFLNKLDSESLAYNLPLAVELEGALDKNKVEEIFRKLICRQESLRTSFLQIDEQPVQIIQQEVQFSMEYYEYVGPDDILKKFVRSFDLQQAPLMRAGLVKLSDRSHLLMIDVHHIISDGMSQGILIKDFLALYNDEKLPVMHLQYKDYSEWQLGKEQQHRMSAHREFWEKEFSEGTNVLDLPMDYPRPTEKSYQGNNKPFKLDREETAALRLLCDESGATLFMTILAILNVLLSRLSTQKDITIGTPVAGRYNANLERIMGVFVNILAIRNEVKEDLGFEDFLLNVKEKTLSCFENQLYPYEELVSVLQLPRDTSRNPLFDVMFTLQNFEQNELSIPGLKLKPHYYDHSISKFDLSLIAMEYEGELHLNFEYCTALFNSKTIDSFISYFKRIVAAVIKDATIKLSQVDILSSDERDELLYGLNDTESAYPSSMTIMELFEDQVERTPGNIAVRIGRDVLTYKELKEKSDRIAYYLQNSKGVKTGDLVGLLLDRESELLPSIFGILKSGAVYVPLSPAYPSARIKSIISDSGLKVLISRGEYFDRLSIEMEAGFLNLDSELSIINEEESPKLKNGATGSDVGYIIYTSGSTGTPKGVMIEHHSIVNRLLWMQKEYELTEDDVLLQKTPLVFDVSIWELFWWSFTGASVCLLGPEEEKDAEKIISCIEENGVTRVHFVPSMLGAFMEMEEREKVRRLGTLQTVFASGEALSPDHVNRFGKTMHGIYGTRLVNLYGPTEATVDVSYHEVDFSQANEIIPIGKPIDNLRLYIVDEHMQLKPKGVAGELCIGGVGLARGYLNNAELTNAKFVNVIHASAERVYKTGDLARYLPDGSIAFLGRLDDQIKIRGYRIEPGEIETQIRTHNEIETAIVQLKDINGEQCLVAYYISATVLKNSDLRHYLSAKLPYYMIPAYFVHIKSLPLTTNGKLDRKELPPVVNNWQESDQKPSNITEELLVNIWSEVLQMDKETIGVDRNFFELGGHSLKVIQIVDHIRKEFSVALKIVDLFSNPTILQQAKLIEMEQWLTEDKINIVKTEKNTITI
ncbi:non-ribosomal peptide synthetase [Mucilaginibacter sp. SJ]|uniref:non-ribosomal peptide synthetase n=1 Tax=Mucilaginibacter sp. SJ TaxID=3029053 RepID=UPI0023A9C2E0|nr:non-ribosomal peptide synthetase [Mucilaginibacter sp. SJ]WEA01642.1 amino acid adenylation domain-containing protein [Mucilaginibacter sp. SJ]